jgi:hypothetical protein
MKPVMTISARKRSQPLWNFYRTTSIGYHQIVVKIKMLETDPQRGQGAPDGTWMIVEPFAHDHLSGNLNPVGRVYFAASTFVCTPASLSQEVGLALGA